ncbi:MAG TPA: hypothetical protein VFB73_01730 [Chloroflexota bacterium]|nr:hypothetical protein [Chloroflexota bacterium]
MHRCPRCQTCVERWATRCLGCGAWALRPIAGGARDDLDEDEEELPQSVAITFTLRSGEAVEVRDFLNGPATEEAIRRYGEALAAEIGTDKVRTFAYWYDDEFYLDAVLMDEVAAFSISADWGEEEEEEE